MTIADKGSRIGNFIIDSIVVVILIIIQAVILNAFFGALSNEVLDLFNIYCCLFYCFYYLLFEYFLGKTPGKYLTKTRVVNYFGEKPTFKLLLIRSALRIMPYDHLSFLFGQGLHDDLSKCLVVNV
jgi:uncharacterized RDD family membrane protein YckC